MVVLIRHTRCAIERGVCYGQLDVPLAATHEQDITHTLQSTPSVDVVFSSPSQRCVLLAERLARRDRCELIVLDDLRELNFGAWEGLAWDLIPRAASDLWADDPWHRAPPLGESEHDLFVRVQRALRRVQACGRVRPALVAHAGPLRLARCLLTGATLDSRWKWMIEQGEVLAIEAPAQFSLDAAQGS
jgi:alpha-ribazole phosphatase